MSPPGRHENTHVAADRIAFGRGLLWRVAREGTAPSHIFGTTHLDDPAVTRLPPPARLILAHSGRLVMETLLDEAAQRFYSGAMRLPPGPGLAPLLGEPWRARYLDLARRYGVADEFALSLTPWAATNLIGRPKAKSGRVMDEVLRDIALASAKPVYGLETMQELVADLQAIAPADHLAMLRDTICNHRRIIEQDRELRQIYLNRDLTGLVAFNERDHDDEALFRRFTERMLYGRGERMVARMQEHLRAGNAFIAVGALHLPGERGILRLLEKQGYTITLEF